MRASGSGLELGLARATHSAEALLEFIDTSLGVHKLLLTGEERVRVGCDTHRNDVVVHTINLLYLVRLGGRARDETHTRSHVLECHGMILGMKIFFHSWFRLLPPRFRRGGTGKMHGLRVVSSRYVHFWPQGTEPTPIHSPCLWEFQVSPASGNPVL